MQASAKELLKFAPGGVFHWVTEALQKDPNSDFELTDSDGSNPISGKFDHFEWNAENPKDYRLKKKTKLVWAVGYFSPDGCSDVMRFSYKTDIVEVPDNWGTDDNEIQ